MAFIIILLIGAGIGRATLRRKYRKLVAGGFDLTRAYKQEMGLE